MKLLAISILKYGKYIDIFCWKMWVAFELQELLTFLQCKNINVFENTSATTVNEFVINMLVKLTMLWTTRLWNIFLNFPQKNISLWSAVFGSLFRVNTVNCIKCVLQWISHSSLTVFSHFMQYCIFTLSIGKPYLLTILVLNFEIVHSTILWSVCMANSVDPDQMPHSAASDLGLHCLQRPICPNT